MKKTKRAVSLLLAAILVLGMTVQVSARTTRNVDFMHGGIVYGQFPQYTDAAFATVNNAIRNDLFTFFSGFGTVHAVQNISGAANLIRIASSIQDEDDFQVIRIEITRRFPGAQAGALHVFTYYVNVVNRTFSREATAFNAFVAARDAAAAPPPAPPPAPTTAQSLNEMILEAFNQIHEIPIVRDAEGYVSLKRYANLFGANVGFNASTGSIEFWVGPARTINPVLFEIDETLWTTNPNVKLDAPIFVVGDDVLVHASFIYPIYTHARIFLQDGVIMIVPK
jgi:hypothetical protein